MKKAYKPTIEFRVSFHNNLRTQEPFLVEDCPVAIPTCFLSPCEKQVKLWFPEDVRQESRPGEELRPVLQEAFDVEGVAV
jgi:hypothetical protein